MPSRTKNIARLALLLVVVGSLAYLVFTEIAARGETDPAAHEAAAANADLIVYYLSEGKDCTTCENIEAYTRETLETHFADRLKSGQIAWLTIDMDKPHNKHYVTEFHLFTKSVVLAKQENGARTEWKNLTEIWEHVYDKADFIEYMRANIQAFLDAPA